MWRLSGLSRERAFEREREKDRERDRENERRTERKKERGRERALVSFLFDAALVSLSDFVGRR